MGVGATKSSTGWLHRHVLMIRPDILVIIGAEVIFIVHARKGKVSRVIVVGSSVRIGNRCLCLNSLLVAYAYLCGLGMLAERC